MTYSDKKHSAKYQLEWIEERKATIQIIVTEGTALWQVSWRDRPDDDRDECAWGTNLKEAIDKAINNLRYDELHPSQR